MYSISFDENEPDDDNSLPEDKLNVDLNIIKIVNWLNNQTEYDEKHYWLVNECWQEIWPNNIEVHSNLAHIKENIVKKFEADKRFKILESFGFYGVFFFLIGSIFFIAGDYYGTPRQYAMGYLSFACGYLFFLVGKYKSVMQQFVHEGEKPTFCSFDSAGTIVGLLACIIGWSCFSYAKELHEIKLTVNGKERTLRFVINLISNILWVFSGFIFVYADVIVGQNYFNWEFYETSCNFLATVLVLCNAIGKVYYDMYNAYKVSTIASCLFFIGGISFVLRAERNITVRGKKNLSIMMKILRHFLNSN